MAELGWIEKLSHGVISWFSRREVKTPLSFYFRALIALSAIGIVAMYQCGVDLRFRVFLIGIFIVAGLCLLVAAFAWFRPKNLVYGETGHRAESRFGLGTEKREIGPAELALLEGTEKPRLLNTE